MDKEIIDLRDLMILIKEKKGLDASLALEFDCKIEVEDVEPLIKVINYSINYINQLSDQPMQIALYAGEKSHSLAFTTFTGAAEFPALSEKIADALLPYRGEINFQNDPGKFAQIQLRFHHQPEEGE